MATGMSAINLVSDNEEVSSAEEEKNRLPDLRPAMRANTTSSSALSQSSSQSESSSNDRGASLRRTKEAIAEERRTQKRKARVVDDSDSDDSMSDRYLQKIASGSSPGRPGKKQRVIDDENDCESVPAARGSGIGTGVGTSTSSTSAPSTSTGTSTSTSPLSSTSGGHSSSTAIHVQDDDVDEEKGSRPAQGGSEDEVEEQDVTDAQQSSSPPTNPSSSTSTNTRRGTACPVQAGGSSVPSNTACGPPPSTVRSGALQHQPAFAFSALPARLGRGSRVQRGPSWRPEYGHQDGGIGRAGTVGGEARLPGWVTVRWDAQPGKEQSYRYTPAHQCCDVVPVSSQGGKNAASTPPVVQPLHPAAARVLSSSASASTAAVLQTQTQKPVQQGIPIVRPRVVAHVAEGPDPSQLPVQDEAAYREMVRKAQDFVVKKFGAQVKTPGGSASGGNPQFRPVFATADRRSEQDRRLEEAARQQAEELQRDVEKRKFLNSLEDRRTKAEGAAATASTSSSDGLPRVAASTWDKLPLPGMGASRSGAGKRVAPRGVAAAEQRVVVVADREVSLETAIQVALLVNISTLQLPAAGSGASGGTAAVTGSARGRASISEAQIHAAYACLGLDPRKSNLELAKKRYRALALYLHPDKVARHVQTAAATQAGTAGTGRSPARNQAEQQQAQTVQQAVEAFKHVNAAHTLLQEALQR